MPEKKPLGEILIQDRLITATQLDEALHRQTALRKLLGEVCLELRYIDAAQLAAALRKQEAEAAGAPPEAYRLPPTARWYRTQRIPIRFKAAGLIVILILGMILPISFLILKKQNTQAERRIISFGSALVNTYANYSAEFVLQEDWPSLDPFIREVGKQEEVRYVFILDQEGTVKAHSDVSLMEKRYTPPDRAVPVLAQAELSIERHRQKGGDLVLDFSRPISYQGRKIGTLHLGVSEWSVVKDARDLRFFIVVLTILAILAGFLLSYGAGVLVSRPLASLVKGTREVGAGNLDYRITPSMNDELGDLSMAFNEMADGLKKKELIQATFGRYVTPEIVDMILSHPDQIWLKGSRQMVTVLFADIRDFTGFSEDREPEEVVTVLNQFFTLATQAIVAEQGFVNKFNGDQVMAVFGAPVFFEDHARRAVRTAVRIQDELDAWNLARQKEGKRAIQAGIGINTGLVVAGNLGSEQRMEYTVIGDDVNLSSRLTSIAGPGETLLSEKTEESVKGMVRLTPLEPIKVKGKKHMVMVYRIDTSAPGAA